MTLPGLRTPLWEHQLEAVGRCAPLPGAMLAMEMGTGKSLTAIALLHGWNARRVLIACPLSVVGVWPRELDQHSLWRWRVARLDDGGVKDKAREAERQLAIAKAEGAPCAVIVNHEAVWREPFRTFTMRQPWDALVVDESHRAKMPGGKLSRYLAQLGLQVPRRLALTGTPLPHSPLDAYGQFRFLARGVFGGSFQRFKDRYAVLGGYKTPDGRPRQIVDWQNMDEFHRKFGMISFQARKADVLDLPEEVDVRRTCRLEKRAIRYYQTLEHALCVEIEAGEITAQNALVKLLRLQQITSGTVTTDEGVFEHVSTAKETLLADVLEDVPTLEPVVVFARFHADLDRIARVAQAQDRRYGEISDRRKDLTEQARMPADIDVMGVQIQAGGVGIDLSRAALGIYYSPGFSLGDYLQSRARLHRPGQTRRTTFVHLEAEHTVDGTVYAALAARRQVVEEVLASAARIAA